jgi:hypothetical protein
MKEQPTYYAIIPANVRYDNTLNMGAKMMYGEVTALSNKKGYCYASNGYFAELYGCSKQAISKWINQLKDRGYVKISYSGPIGEVERRVSISVDRYQPQLTPLSTTVDPPINGSGCNNTSTNTTRENNTSKGFSSLLIEIFEAEYLGPEWFKDLGPTEKIEQSSHLAELIKKISNRAGVPIPETEPETVAEGLRLFLQQLQGNQFKWERQTYRTIKQLNQQFTNLIEKAKSKNNGTAKATDQEPSIDEILAGIDRAVQGGTAANTTG